MSINKQNIKTIVEKIKSVVTLKQELNQKLIDFLEYLLELNETYNTEENTKLENNTNNNHLFAPYVYIGCSNNINLIDCFRKTKLKNYILAFLVNKNGTPCWDNGKSYKDSFLDEELDYIYKKGGKIIISTGGAGSGDLPKTIPVKDCFNCFKYLIDKYHIYGIDFDIEGGNIANDNDIHNRIELIKLLKKEYPNIYISFTLPIDPDGFRDNGLKLINTTLLYTKIDCINLMTMDYGSYYAPNGKTEMAKYAIKCIEKVIGQLEGKNLKIGCTSMIGVNDCVDEIFTLDNAKELVNYCIQHKNVYLLSYWSLNRDNGNKVNLTYADPKYSGLEQNLFDFTKIFNQFN